MPLAVPRDYSPVHPHEVYRYLSLAIDVCAAWRIIAALSPEEQAVRAGRLTLPRTLLEQHWIDTDKAMGADLTVPLLVGQFINRHPAGDTVGKQVIDGWHRVYKAAQLGKRTLPAFWLTVKETQACRLDGGQK
jgi:hypothetical protein